MEHCQHRPRALRALVVVLVVLVASRFALQVMDGGVLLRETATRSETSRSFADAFPTAEASVVGGR